MSSNHLVVSWRSLQRERAYAAINAVGLALGIACAILLGLYLDSELTYDRHNVQHENIFRVATTVDSNGKVDRAAVSSRRFGELVKQNFPEVVDFVRFEPVQAKRLIFRNGDNQIYWENVYLADQNVFDYFDHEVIHGDPATALVDPLSVAVSESVARTYFGDANPIGETLATDTAAYRITMVFKDLPQNTHLRYGILLSYNRIQAFFEGLDIPIEQQLWSIQDYTYLVMQDGYDPRDFGDISSRFYDRFMRERGEQVGSSMRFELEPLASIHYFSDAQYDLPGGNVFYLWAFAGIAAFVLLVACINYMNLATARSTKRAKEVGMRRLLGATRSKVVAQFLTESFMYAFIALVAALVIVWVVANTTTLPDLLGVEMSLDFFDRPELLFAAGALWAFVGLVSGLYPAFYLSVIKPMSAVTGRTRTGKDSAGRLRQFLVFLQFTISSAVIAATVLMALQMRYVDSLPLGYDKDHQLVIRLHGADLIEQMPYLKNEVQALPGVLGVATSLTLPGDNLALNLVEAEGGSGDFEPQSFNRMGVDSDFFEVMGIEVLEGRSFGDDTPFESSILVNETAVRTMGWDQPIGKRINSGNFKNQVIGVVQDFNFHSVHRSVEPLFIHTLNNDFSELTPLNRLIVTQALIVKLDGARTAEVVQFLRDRWPELDPKHPFEYEFLDETLAGLYASDDRLMRLIGVFAGVCIVVSCLGLFGLAAFTTEQRTKEIGVRKILGATTTKIVVMLCNDITLMLIGACIVGSTIAWFSVDAWLEGFEYRLGINPAVFLGAAVITAVLAYLTVAVQSFKVARARPALSLGMD